MNDGNGNQPTYDAENTMATDAGVTYDYDADGVRTEKSSGTLYWPGPGGEYLAETDLTGTINEEYIYFNGERIARVDRPSGTVHYYFSDHLGSSSVITDASGTIEQQYVYFPYGGMADSSGTDPNHYKFNGKERDTESGLDEFGARYYASSMGRFLIPDWADKPTDVPYAHFGNPQSLNLYSYVQNNPTTFGDPDGHANGGPPVNSSGAGAWPVPCGDDCEIADAAPVAAWILALNTGQVTLLAQNQPQQQAQQTQQQDQTQQPTSGHLNINWDAVLKKTSDFSAGAGDCLTGSCIPFVHGSLTQLARGDADSVVDKKSLSYKGGEVTGGAVGSALLSAGGATLAALADGKNGALFGRGLNTVFNSSKVRFGWGWQGSATAGQDVIRLGIGAARGTSWWSHIVFWVP
jgi:RHS repeat-associated protein